ncbi:MAG TPA: amino acid-binding protein [Verrucomicrobiales bacterium]|nr:amino acid-binding protein [Verrucomicrobiales bacterium]
MKHTIHRQLTVAIENQPGRLAAIGRTLADNGINIRDLSVNDTVEQGVVRLIPSDPDRARELLAGAGLYVIEAEVLAIDLRDMPGTLARVSQALADAGVNIDYAYGSEDSAEEKLRLILKVSHVARAREVLDGMDEDPKP